MKPRELRGWMAYDGSVHDTKDACDAHNSMLNNKEDRFGISRIFEKPKIKFREYKGLFVKVLQANRAEDLEWAITKAATEYEMVDMQYSTTNWGPNTDAIHFSALLLLKDKE
ncbi:MAG: hypothetical protein J5598_00600 [Clostridia bacterium]|nr:hypothetical protein [Clostridia bacterium]